MNVSFSYVFTRGSQLPVGVDFNMAPNFDASKGRTVTETYDVLTGAGGATTQTFALPLYYARLVPATSVINGNISSANSTYHALIVTYRIPTSHGLTFLANYTLSHFNG